MAGRSSRNKGARGEREMIAVLQPIVDRVCDECGQPRFEIRRNYTQRFQAKECDLIGIPWMSFEVKRVENLSGMGGWWRQTLKATREGQVPVLFYRQNHKGWKVRFRVALDAGRYKVRSTVTVDLATFLVWFEHRLKSELGSGPTLLHVNENRR